VRTSNPTKQFITYVHIQRMADSRQPKQVLEWLPSEWKKKGTPRFRRIRGIYDVIPEK
jgi:hypothetical protein